MAVLAHYGRLGGCLFWSGEQLSGSLFLSLHPEQGYRDCVDFNLCLKKG